MQFFAVCGREDGFESFLMPITAASFWLLRNPPSNVRRSKTAQETGLREFGHAEPNTDVSGNRGGQQRKVGGSNRNKKKKNKSHRELLCNYWCTFYRNIFQPSRRRNLWKIAKTCITHCGMILIRWLKVWCPKLSQNDATVFNQRASTVLYSNIISRCGKLKDSQESVIMCCEYVKPPSLRMLRNQEKVLFFCLTAKQLTFVWPSNLPGHYRFSKMQTSFIFWRSLGRKT